MLIVCIDDIMLPPPYILVCDSVMMCLALKNKCKSLVSLSLSGSKIAPSNLPQSCKLSPQLGINVKVVF